MAFSLQLTTTMEEIIKDWIRQTPELFDKSSVAEIKEKKYMNSLMALFGLFARYHESIEDFDFIRIFQFFKDIGVTKRLSADTHLFQRMAKIEKDQDKATRIEAKEQETTTNV